ncbi:MAG: phage portal protein, partial [Nitratireductor sp.]|nr:phage portal protein [Nitratireductor sp.]
CPPVFAAVKVHSETISQLPVHLYRRLDQGKERAPKHPAARLLKNPNAWTTGVDFRKQAMVDICLHGNAYCWIGRNTKQEPVELRRIDPTAVTIETKESGEPAYKVTTKNGAQKVYPFTEILHFKGPSKDGLKGESPVEVGKKAIALAMTLENYALNLFENGARPSGVIETKSNL